MKISTKHRDMARRLLAEPEDTGRRWRTTNVPVIEAELVSDYEEFLLEEGIVRARLTDAEINVLASELKLDLSLEESWVTLEAMTMWI